MGDGDGSNGVSWVSRDKFRRQWVSPIPSQHAAFVCAGAGRITYVSVCPPGLSTGCLKVHTCPVGTSLKSA